MERVAQTTVSRADADTPLVEYLVRRFTYLKRGDWDRAVGEGAVTVNGAPAGPRLLLAESDLVRFSPAAFAEPETDARFAVLYEDDEAAVVDKPPNLPVHPGGRFFKGSLWYLLRDSIPNPRILTRLDRETSGLVLVAKSAAEAGRLQTLQAAGAVEKSYLALVHGVFPERIDALGALVPDPASAVRKKRAYIDSADPRFMEAAARGERCETRLELVWSSRGRSLVRARLVTGRTHQIRATLCSLGFPLVGDKLYGLDETAFLRFAEGTLTEEDRSLLDLPFQALHCARLAFGNSAGRRIEIEAPPPPWTGLPEKYTTCPASPGSRFCTRR